MSGGTYNRDSGWWIYPIAIIVICVILIVGAFSRDDPSTCSEYGTVMVTVDETSRCVPWEQAPDIQEFPEP